MSSTADGASSSGAFKLDEETEKRSSAIAPYELRNKRGALTRCTTKIVKFVAEAGDSLESLQQAKRLADNIDSCWQELKVALQRQVSAFAAAGDHVKIEEEYNRQAPYDIQMEDHREMIQQRIDHLSGCFRAGSQELSGFSQQVQEESDVPAAVAESQHLVTSDDQHNHAPSQGLPYDASSQIQYTGEGSERQGTAVVKIKDPEKKITKFNGNPAAFRKWWSIFSVYVDTQNIAATEKFRLLESALSGRAAKAVSHLDFNGESYEIAKDIITRRFGNVDRATSSHVHSIHTACMTKDLESHDKFIDFVSTIGQHIRTLFTLGGSYEALTITLTPVILDCLPLHYRRKFKEISKYSNDPEVAALETLLIFLEEEAIILEECLKPNKNSRNNNSQNGKKKFQKDDTQSKSEANSNKGKFAFAGTTSSPDSSCLFCKGSHPSSKCGVRLSPEERKRCVESQKACLKCLRKTHEAKKCRAKVGKCSICGGKHHAMVCTRMSGEHSANAMVANRPSEPAVIDSEEAQPTNSYLASNAGLKSREIGTFLQTGYVWAMALRAQKICRVLLDPGSQKSFVTKRVTEALGISPVKTQRLKIFGITGIATSEDQVKIFEFKLKSRFSNNQITINCIEVPNVVGSQVPRAVFNGELREIADVRCVGFSDEIDLIVGCDYLHLVYDGMYKRFGNLTASPTIFGWFIWGSDGTNQISKSVITTVGITHSWAKKSKPPKSVVTRVPEDIEFLWETEFLGISQPEPVDGENHDKEMEARFKKLIRRTPEGRYSLLLPFKEDISGLGDNEKLAFSRLFAFLKEAKKKPELLKAVDEEIGKFISRGFAEIAEPRKPGQKAHYLPLLAVAKKSLANAGELKVRVVKDGGSRSKNAASLNDVLETGPSLLPDLIQVLLHFRRWSIAIVADIESAFSQFGIDKEHRTFLRFYWPLGISKNPSAPIQTFWASALDFGLVCSPWLHCAGIRYHLEAAAANRPQQAEFLEEIKRTFYMDDLCSGKRTISEARAAVRTLIEVFSEGFFPLNKWATNSKQLAEYIRSVSPSKDCKITSANPQAKFLGIHWNQISDTLFIDTESVAKDLRTGTPTKRKLLSCLSQIYDPLNFLAPITINFKFLFQKMWQQGVDWDSPLEGELSSAYDAAVENLEFAKRIRFDRTLFLLSRRNSRRELHVFADASLLAYGCVAYVRESPLPGHQGQTSVRFVLAKARVAPLKGKWTIPRLELLAAVLATRIAKCIKGALPGQFDRTFMYSDNASVLGWIRDRPDRWKTFVAHRIREIQTDSEVSSWEYVRSAENSSDLLSRGSPLDTPELLEFWETGPRWLKSQKHPEPHALNDNSVERSDIIREKKRETVTAVVNVSDSKQTLFVRKLSTWEKSVRVMAYVRRFIAIVVRRKSNPPKLPLLIDFSEYKQAETALLRHIQKVHFPEAVKSRALNIPKSSCLHNLNPFLGENDLIRCRSRLEKSKNLLYTEKFPAILPRDEFLVELLVRCLHAGRCLHFGGVASVLQQIREKYFIIGARRMAKKAILGCKICVRFKAQQAQEPIPPLPAFRIDQCPPFSCVGTDHAGPIYIKGPDGKRQKSYILLFVCAVSRAIRLELVANLTTEEFMLALRRFISRNPFVTRIVSDNSRTFKLADKELNTMFNHVKTPKVSSFLISKGIQWQYSTDKAPWANGFFERMVSVVKKPLRKVLGTHALSFRELEAVLTEIERMANDRPISAISCDPDEPKALTPSMLLYGYTGRPGLPETSSILKASDNASAMIFSERFKKQQTVLRGFWKQFSNDYLQFLRSAHYRRPLESRSIKPGDVCLLKSDAPSRAYWPLVRILSVYGGQGTDRRQRSCEIKTVEGKILKRPIQLLYPLEVANF